ncbi:MAG TPA: NAD(P)-dependent oxidoreductase [Nitrososphaera sp.]|nr:NAD(P)-dependent oxidoreductase [Nitrososphaera sp.]
MKVEPKRVGQFPFRKAEPEERKSSFSEVQQPYSEAEVMQEADRCLLCGTPVCIDACPVLLDVRGMNEAVARGDFKTAYERIRETNPLLGVTGRCCPQLQGLCEDACVLKWSGQPIGIGLIQRYVADWERKNKQQPPDLAQDTGKSVAVIGAGPSGIAGADLLRRYGHHVIIYEALPSPGGTAWYGIPDYHLPKDVLLHEIEKVGEMGVEIKTNLTIGKDISLSQILDENDAMLITTGSKDPKSLDVAGSDLQGVIDGYEFLENVFVNGVNNYLKNPKYILGNDIIVIGGGDTALDCARTALRLTRGQGNVTIVYRRGEEDMPADPIMIEEAKEEGVKFRFLAQPKSFEGSSKDNNRLVAAVMDSMQLGVPDQSGRRHPESVPGREFKMHCSAVLLAIGRGPDSFLQEQTGLKMSKHNSIAINDNYKTSMKRVFAAGDVTSGETLVVKAMESGREAAQRVHEYLMGLEDQHISFYERYYKQNLYDRMLEGKADTDLPPD